MNNSKENIIKVKSYNFSLKIVKLYKTLISNFKDYVISKQILRSGTSIGANVHEAAGGQSKADFLSKMQIAYKEALETEYWIHLLKDTNYIDNSLFSELTTDCTELIKILTAILSTGKSRK